MERFTNKSPGALTMEQAIERHKKSIAEDRRRLLRNSILGVTFMYAPRHARRSDRSFCAV